MATTEKIVNSRISCKHDIEANWGLAVNFIPKAGELILYDPDSTYNYTRMKIGDGVTKVAALPFFADKIIELEKKLADFEVFLVQQGEEV